MIDGKYRELVKCKCRDFYRSLNKNCVPAAIGRWEHYGVRPCSWREIYEIPYKCTKSTRLQSLQFRITNRYIPTRKYLCTRGVVGSPLCRKCFEVDDFQHFFFDCDDVKPLWNEIISQLSNKFSLPTNFNTYQSIILGYPAAPPIVNLILLLTKQYIVSSKLCNEDEIREPQISCLMEIISRHACAEKIMARDKNTLDKYHKKWGKMIDNRSGNVVMRHLNTAG